MSRVLIWLSACLLPLLAYVLASGAEPFAFDPRYEEVQIAKVEPGCTCVDCDGECAADCRCPNAAPAPPEPKAAPRYTEGQKVRGYTLHGGIWWKGGIGKQPYRTEDGWAYRTIVPKFQTTETRLVPAIQYRGLFRADCVGGT